MIDAGTKSLTSDLLGLQGYGIIPEFGDAKIYEANEEHGYVDLAGSAAQARRSAIGCAFCPITSVRS